MENKQLPKCIKNKNPCEKHFNNTCLKHACGKKKEKVKRTYSLEQRKKMSETSKKLGLKPPSRKGVKLSLKQCEKMSKYLKGINKGEKQWNWKGGITPIQKRIRLSLQYKLWRESVFVRDNWTCQKTGEKGGKLHPHHIKNFAQFPELRFAIDNGITLSEKSHKEFHKLYGLKNNTREQLINYLTKNI